MAELRAELADASPGRQDTAVTACERQVALELMERRRLREALSAPTPVGCAPVGGGQGQLTATRRHVARINALDVRTPAWEALDDAGWAAVTALAPAWRGTAAQLLTTAAVVAQQAGRTLPDASGR